MTNFSSRVMLVSLNVKAYGAKKEDKKISRDVAAQHNTTVNAGKYSKALVTKEQLKPINEACSAIRQFHYENTLPWLDEGIRVLPAANYERYKAEMETLRDTYDSAVRRFVDNWDNIVEDARSRLNGMFNASDYPADVRKRFGTYLRFLPAPDAGDFRADISDDERARLRAEIEATLSNASREAMKDLWQRVAECVAHMAERLAAYTVDPVTGKASNIFRDTLVGNLRDLCNLLPALNFAGDSKLEALRVRIESELLAFDADTLRERDGVRASVAAKAQAIAASLAEFMV